MTNQWGQGKEVMAPKPEQCGNKYIRPSRVLFHTVEFHILRDINYSGMMQRIYLRSRLHQIRVLCLWVTRRNWGPFLSAGAANHLRPNQPNMPTATSTKLENVEGWQENPKCVPYLCLLYSNGMYSNTVKITLEILHLNILNLWNVHSVTNSNLYITICISFFPFSFFFFFFFTRVRREDRESYPSVL